MTFASGDLGLCQYEGRGLLTGGPTGILPRLSMLAKSLDWPDFSGRFVGASLSRDLYHMGRLLKLKVEV
jgi:hypothetical protein